MTEAAHNFYLSGEIDARITDKFDQDTQEKASEAYLSTMAIVTSKLVESIGEKDLDQYVKGVF